MFEEKYSFFSLYNAFVLQLSFRLPRSSVLSAATAATAHAKLPWEQLCISK